MNSAWLPLKSTIRPRSSGTSLTVSVRREFFLRRAVLENLEIVLRQIGDQAAGAVAHGKAHVDEMNVGTERRVLRKTKRRSEARYRRRKAHTVIVRAARRGRMQEKALCRRRRDAHARAGQGMHAQQCEDIVVVVGTPRLGGVRRLRADFLQMCRGHNAAGNQRALDRVQFQALRKKKPQQKSPLGRRRSIHTQAPSGLGNEYAAVSVGFSIITRQSPDRSAPRAGLESDTPAARRSQQLATDPISAYCLGDGGIGKMIFPCLPA